MISLLILTLFPTAAALWVAAIFMGLGVAFNYPSLMALTVNRASDRDRAMAVSSFTMFFEVGNISGGVVFGLIAQLASKRAAFGSAVVLCGVGAWLLLTRVAPLTRSARRDAAPVLSPVAAD
jgi:MFS family permease